MNIYMKKGKVKIPSHIFHPKKKIFRQVENLFMSTPSKENL